MAEQFLLKVRCCKTGNPYVIVYEGGGGNWYAQRTLEISERAATSKGYGATNVSGNFLNGPNFKGCPFCGNMNWFRCNENGNGSHCGCYGGGDSSFCQDCKTTVPLSGTVTEINAVQDL